MFSGKKYFALWVWAPWIPLFMNLFTPWAVSWRFLTSQSEELKPTSHFPSFSEIHLFTGAGYVCPCLSDKTWVIRRWTFWWLKLSFQETLWVSLFSQRFICSGAGYVCPCLSDKTWFIRRWIFWCFNLPSRKHHRSRSPQGEADSYQLELHPSHGEMWNAIRGLLHLEVPRVECLVAPASS